MEYFVIACVLTVALPLGIIAGFWVGVRVTVRRLDRVLAVMPDAEVVAVARRARARKELMRAGSS